MYEMMDGIEKQIVAAETQSAAPPGATKALVAPPASGVEMAGKGASNQEGGGGRGGSDVAPETFRKASTGELVRWARLAKKLAVKFTKGLPGGVAPRQSPKVTPGSDSDESGGKDSDSDDDADDVMMGEARVATAPKPRGQGQYVKMRRGRSKSRKGDGMAAHPRGVPHKANN